MSFYKKSMVITDHAKQRFIERSKKKMSLYEAELEMRNLLEDAIDIRADEPGVNHLQIRGTEMVFVVKGDAIITFKWK